MWEAYAITFIGGLMVGSSIYNLWTEGARGDYVLCAVAGLCLGWIGLTL